MFGEREESVVFVVGGCHWIACEQLQPMKNIRLFAGGVDDVVVVVDAGVVVAAAVAGEEDDGDGVVGPY